MAWPDELQYVKDSNGNVVGLSNVSYIKTLDNPYYGASWGDSRVSFGLNTTGYDLAVTTVSKAYNRSPGWFEAYRGDIDLIYSFGYAGSAQAAWRNLSGSDRGLSSKTYQNLNKVSCDFVIYQYGVNDAMAGTSAATIIADTKANITEILKSGKKIIYEAIYPVNVGATNYVATQGIINDVNLAIQTWIDTLDNNNIIYVDTATQLKDINGYFSVAYSADGVHPNQAGAMLIGKIVANASKNLLPKRAAKYFGKDNNSANMLNTINPTVSPNQFFKTDAVGTFDATTLVVGSDSIGDYYEVTLNATSLVSGAATARLEFSVNFQTSSANSPFYSLSGNEMLQGQARIVIDDGVDGAPNCNAVGLRQRFYTGSVFTDWGSVVSVAGDASFNEKLDIHVMTPQVANQSASAVANPGTISGYQLHLFVGCIVVGVPFRVRVYNPALRINDNHKLVLTATGYNIPATGVAYTNVSNGVQQVTIGGGTVSAIAINGSATGLTNGAFVLSPNDTITPTYTVAPTWKVKQV